MKRIIPLLLLSITLFSCQEDDDVDYGLGVYYQELATVKDNSSFLLDDGTLLLPESKDKTANLNKEDRVRILFSFPDNNKTAERKIKLHSVTKLSKRELQVQKKEIIEQQNSEPFRLESIWIGSHYVNMQFYINFNSIAHHFSLVCAEEDIYLQEINLYVLHDSRNNPEGAPVYQIMSTDLEKILGIPTGERKLLVHINTSNYGEKIYELSY